ncbi:MAG: LPXTG cell wall anchor domain-containing protein, partial [Clostridiales bacterium]|nr:LPXTG cell wall anchor domain-containing protein [Clostridiales bacterium]
EEAGTYYFAKDGKVFAFSVTEAGWYDLDGAVKTDAAAYQEYLEGLRDDDSNSIELKAGTYYFVNADKEVFMFEVAVDGWFKLDGATSSDEVAYNAYIESLAVENDGTELAVGMHYFAKDGKVFVFEVAEAGWYGLDGATETDAAAYQAYLESLRAADTSAVNLAAGTYYFAKDGKVFMFAVAADGWFNLDGAVKTDAAAYQAYIASLAVAGGGIFLEAGETHYFEDADGKVFVFEVAEAGWYDLGGAEQVSINAYTAYIEGLRDADDNSIELAAGTYYFKGEDGEVFMFVVAADDWFNLDGAVETDEDAYNDYIASLAVDNGGVELGVGTHYFAKDGKVFMFEVKEAGWYGLDGAIETNEAAYQVYLESLRAADKSATNLTVGTYYFEKDGEVFMFAVAEAGWYDLDGAEETDAAAYQAYIEGLAVADGGIELAVGTYYFKSEDGKVFMFTVKEAGWYDLDGAVETDETAYKEYLKGLAIAGGAFYLEENGDYYYNLDGVIYKATATADGWYKIPEDAVMSTKVEYEAALGEYLEELDKYWDELKTSLGLMDFNKYESAEAAYNAAMEAVEKMNTEAKAAYEAVCDGWWASILVQFPSSGLENSWKDYEGIGEAAAAAQIAADEANAAAYEEYVIRLHEMWDDLYKQYGAYLDYDNLEEFLAAYDGDLGKIQIIINQAFEDKKADVIAQRPPMHKQLAGLSGAQGNIQNSNPGNNSVPAPTNPLTSSGSTISLGAGVTLRYQSNNAFLDIDSSAAGFELGVYDFYYRSGGKWYHMVIDIVEIINNGSFQISLQGYANSGMQAIYGDRATHEEEAGQLPSPPTPVGLADPTDAPEDVPFPNPLPEGGFSDGIPQSYNIEDNEGDLNGYNVEDNRGDLNGYNVEDNKGDLDGYGDLDENIGNLFAYILTTNPDTLDDYTLGSNPGSLQDYTLTTNLDVLDDYTLGSNIGSLLDYILATNPDALEGYGDLGDNIGNLRDYILATNPAALEGYGDLGSNPGSLLDYILATNPDVLDGYTLGSNTDSLLAYILATNPDTLAGYTLGSNTGDLLDYILATNPGALEGFDLEEILGGLDDYTRQEVIGKLDEFKKDNPGKLKKPNGGGSSSGNPEPETEPETGTDTGSQTAAGGAEEGQQVSIDESDVPKAAMPEVKPTSQEEERLQTDIPQTGVGSEAGMFGLFGLSLFGLAAAFRARRKITE